MCSMHFKCLSAPPGSVAAEGGGGGGGGGLIFKLSALISASQLWRLKRDFNNPG